jgi:hypothetical protein
VAELGTAGVRVLVAGDPLEDIAPLRHIRRVMLDGAGSPAARWAR